MKFWQIVIFNYFNILHNFLIKQESKINLLKRSHVLGVGGIFQYIESYITVNKYKIIL